MTSKDVENKFLQTGTDVRGDYKTLTLGPDCQCDLTIGYSRDIKRSLILTIPASLKLTLMNDIKEHVSLNYYDVSGHLVITLLENTYQNIFNDFILSVYEKMKSIADPAKAAEQFVSVFRQWSEFFLEAGQSILTREDIQGLYGEIYYLKNILRLAQSHKINSVLASWTGPYDRGQDFMLDSKTVEIKTKETGKVDVQISSEFQLQQEVGKDIELLIISVDINTGRGTTLRESILELKELVNARGGDFAIILKALRKKTLTLENIGNYDNWVFYVRKEVTFDCAADGFPKLVVSNIPRQTKKLTYTLRLTDLDNFIINTTEH